MNCRFCCYHRRIDMASYNPQKSNWAGDHLSIYEGGYGWRRQVAVGRVQLIEVLSLTFNNRNKPCSLLDWGGASGIFALEALKQGYDSWVLEPDPVFSREAERRLPGRVLLSESMLKGRLFDFVVCFDSIGYSGNLCESLNYLKAVVRKKGFILFSAGLTEHGKVPHDLSFNYFFEDGFFKVSLPCILNFEPFRYWTEDRNFNTRRQSLRSVDWWKEYLQLTTNPKVQYTALSA
jgi:hypothetical protein